MPPMLFSVPSMLVIVPLGLRLTWLQNSGSSVAMQASSVSCASGAWIAPSIVDVVVVGLDQQALETAAQRDLPREAGRQGFRSLRLQVAIAAGVDGHLRVQLHVVRPARRAPRSWPAGTGLTAVLQGSVIPESKREPRLNSSPMFGARNPSA